jgi:hypothetical protein
LSEIIAELTYGPDDLLLVKILAVKAHFRSAQFAGRQGHVCNVAHSRHPRCIFFLLSRLWSAEESSDIASIAWGEKLQVNCLAAAMEKLTNSDDRLKVGSWRF